MPWQSGEEGPNAIELRNVYLLKITITHFVVLVRVIEKSDLYLKAVVDGVTPPLVNSLRRVLISDVPVLAIDEVIILDNTSVLYDEVLAHRLSMIPIKTDLKKLPKIEECEQELVDPSLCQVRFELNIEAKEPVVVYSRDLKSDDPEVRPVYEDIPIAKLVPGQKIVLELMPGLVGLGVTPSGRRVWRRITTTRRLALLVEPMISAGFALRCVTAPLRLRMMAR